MRPSIALARPHPNIVEDMMRLVEEIGCESYCVDSSEKVLIGTSVAVVSTATSTSPARPTQETAAHSTSWQYFQEVVEDLRKLHPRMPIVLTTTNLTTEWILPPLRFRIPSAGLVRVSPSTAEDPNLLGDPYTFLVLRKADIETGSNLVAHARTILSALAAKPIASKR